MPKKSVLNYTTQIALEKTIAEIQTMLSEAKVEAIMSEFSDGTFSALSFRIRGLFGMMFFRLPANIDKVYALLQRSRNIAPKYRTKEQASRVAWRIIKAWLEAQLALVRIEMVTMEQVFLPYVQNPNTGKTLYESLESDGFKGLALPAPK